MPHKIRMDYIKSQIIHWSQWIDQASVGLLVTFLYILRLILRYRHGAPTPPC